MNEDVDSFLSEKVSNLLLTWKVNSITVDNTCVSMYGGAYCQQLRMKSNSEWNTTPNCISGRKTLRSNFKIQSPSSTGIPVLRVQWINTSRVHRSCVTVPYRLIWGLRGLIWSFLGLFLGVQGLIWGLLGLFLGVWGLFWGLLEPFGPVPGGPKPVFGAFWAYPWGFEAWFGAFWASPWGSEACNVP